MSLHEQPMVTTDATPSTPGASALAHELSCRFLTPLLDIAEAEGQREALGALLARWGLTPAEVRDQSNWVSLRFWASL